MMTLERQTIRDIIEVFLFLKTLLIFLWGRYQKSIKKETNHD